jgi:glycerophosphoryl diester phosphodiesterase
MYTNSLEAFRCNHERGFRWFEVDLALTADGQLMCFHKGQEALAGMDHPIEQLPRSEVDTHKYRGRFQIPRFADLLEEADRFGDVVLVTDTKNWTKRMLQAVSAAVGDAPRRHSTRFVFQSYGEKDIAAVAQLADQLGSGIILSLYATNAVDTQVEALAKQYGVIAVVADRRRFTPWLAQRLHAASVPLLVHTLNNHAEIMDFMRAGADGIYTDTYLPLALVARNVKAAMDCGANEPSRAALQQWLQRDVLHPGDYRLSGCAKRRGMQIDVGGCDDQPAIFGPYLAVPPGQTVHVALDVEALETGAKFWFDVVHKHRKDVIRPREELALKPKERRLFDYDLTIPAGSAGIETRLGLAAASERLVVRRFDVTLSSLQQGAPVEAMPDVADAKP